VSFGDKLFLHQEAAYVAERQLMVFGWQNEPVWYYDEPRRIQRWSSK
jgi:hypothetical protein